MLDGRGPVPIPRYEGIGPGKTTTTTTTTRSKGKLRLSLRIDALCKQMRIYVFACFYSPPPPRTFNLSSAAAHCRSISSFSPPCRRGETRAPMPILCVRWPGQQSQESSFWARPTYSDMVHNAHNMTIERQSDVSAPGLLLLLLLSDLPSASMTLAASKRRHHDLGRPAGVGDLFRTSPSASEQGE